ncbi:MAG: HAD family hydrolase [Leptolyngbyaceae cyanobacterium bins.59]|nr:HAD family hydrolase [Leptolyngbyaceae cyanobacterium bins.59]
MVAAVFLDKDGTLIEDVPYNVNPDLIRLMPGAVDGLRLLHQAGYRLIIVSNQSGVAQGFFPETALKLVEERLKLLLERVGVPLAGFYYCPHFPTGTVPELTIACNCRKPAPGMLLKAAQDHHLDLTASWMIGDILHDVEAGRRAGCRTILLDNGHETEWQLSPQRVPHFVVPTLAEAAKVITFADRYPPASAVVSVPFLKYLKP